MSSSVSPSAFHCARRTASRAASRARSYFSDVCHGVVNFAANGPHSDGEARLGMMRLTDPEKAMLDGRDGKARQKAMELLVRYAEALGADALRRHPQRGWGARLRQPRSCSSTTRAKTWTASTPSSRSSISTPTSSSKSRRRSCRRSIFRAAPIRGSWQTLGVKVEVFRNYQEREALRRASRRHILKTCTPYLAGNVPARGEHLRVDGIVCRDLLPTQFSARAPTPKDARARARRC